LLPNLFSGLHVLHQEAVLIGKSLATPHAATNDRK
jgi:hypothetical protein